MGKIKIANSGEYCISKNEEGAIKVSKEYANVKGALREIAGNISFEYDEGWNTRQFGKKLIEAINQGPVKTNEAACAEFGEYVISKNEEGSIQVYKEYDNVKGALREIAGNISFEYDEGWNTHQFGSKLIDHLNQ